MFRYLEKSQIHFEYKDERVIKAELEKLHRYWLIFPITTIFSTRNKMEFSSHIILCIYTTKTSKFKANCLEQKNIILIIT